MKTKTPQQAVDSTKRAQYIDKSVLDSALKTNKPSSKLEFFKVGKYISDDELEKEYESRGLIPADIYTLCDFDVKNPKEMDEKQYIGTHFKDADGKWCFVAFRRWDGERDVRVDRDGGFNWDGTWWFGGLRKSSALKSSVLKPLDLLNLELRIKKLEKALDDIADLLTKRK